MVDTKGKTKPKTKATLEVELKEAEIQLKKLEIRGKEFMIQAELVRVEESKTRLMLEQISKLDWMLQSLVIDEEKSVFGSEPKFMRVYTEEEVYLIKDKLFKTLKKV